MKKLLLTIILIMLAMHLFAGTEEKTWNCYLVTVGPGDPLYIWFGHTGLILENTETGRSVFYDFGNFSFESDHFYRNFAMGRLIYSSVGVSARAYMNYIVGENRDVTVQTLNLPEEKIREMASYLSWKVQPGNNTYLYHHYLDNCSTRIRDLIDQAVDGQLKEATDISAVTSFRDSFRRYSSHSFWADWLLSFLQGRTIDRDITVWDTMFLPDELMKQAALLQIKTSDGIQPLVTKTESLAEAEGRRAVPDRAPSNGKQALITGIAAGILMLLLHTGSLLKQKALQRFSRFFLKLLFFILGAAGCFLYFLAFVSNHLVAHENLNVFLFHPLYLVLIFLFPGRNSQKRKTLMVRFWQIQLGIFLITSAVNLLPAFGQDNLRTFLFFLPLLAIQGVLFPLVLKSGITGAYQSSGLLNRAIAVKTDQAGRDEP